MLSGTRCSHARELHGPARTPCKEFLALAVTMTSPHARVVPWHAVVQFHRGVAQRARQRFFTLPVSASASQRWRSLGGFEPRQLAGPWEVDPGALAGESIESTIEQGLDEAIIGGPCWYRRKSAGEQQSHFDWIPLIYREVTIEHRDGRLHLEPARDGWQICPLVTQFLEQRDVQTAAPLDEMLPELLASAESNASEDGSGVTAALIDAFRSAAPELGELLDQARNDLPEDQMEFVPSPWVLITVPAEESLVTRHICQDYEQLDRHLAADPHAIGGLRLLEDASGAVTHTASAIVPVLPLDDTQRAAVESVLAKRPVTIIRGPPGCGKHDVILSALLNAWAGSTSVLFASHDRETIDDVRERLKSFDSNLEIALGSHGRQTGTIDEALGRSLEVIAARRGESFYGGSPTSRKREQLIKKKQVLRELLDSQMPQRLVKAIRAAFKSHSAYRKAVSALEARRENLASKLRGLGVGDNPDVLDEQLLDPLRKWRNGVDSTRRLIDEDTQRVEALQKELSDAQSARDSVLADYEIEIVSDQKPLWLLAEPGFKSFEKAVVALTEKLREPIEEDLTDSSWDDTYDAWSSSAAATEWERKARETAALMRPASIALKEKTEEVYAARKALETAERAMQTATKASSLDVRRKDLDEWAACYAELCAMPRSKLAFLQKSKHTELVRQLEEVEQRFRSTFPPHLWTSIGKLDETGRERLSAVLERAREWLGARDDWDRLSPIREEIGAETDALRERLSALDMRFETREVTPASCAAMASKLNDKAAVAASAAEAWAKREARERLPGELAELAAQIRTAGAGTPIKERWITGPGASLMTAFDAVAGEPGAKSINAVRSALLESAQVEPVVQSWGRAYEAEQERVGLTEELERIPPRSARLANWKSRRPAALPAELDAEGAFDGDDTHPVWALLKACEEWSRGWQTFQKDEAPVLERTIDSEGTTARRHMGEAAQTLPPGKDRAWLESLANDSTQGETWPLDKVKERLSVWSPKRLQGEIEKADAQLERITFDTVKDRWLERVASDAEGVRALEALQEHYKHHDQHIEEDGYGHFERALKVQPVWVTTLMSTQSIPLKPGLFDLLVIDDARKCTLTDILPLVFRAKCLVVVGDPDQTPAPDRLGADAQRALAARFGIEGWVEIFGHVGNDAFEAAVGKLPGRKVETISLGDAA